MRKIVQVIFVLIFSSSYYLHGQSVPEEIVTNWSKPATVTPTPLNADDDAVIIFNRRYVSCHNVSKDGVLSVIPVESFHRKIKINSQNGLDNFVSVYVPVLQDVLNEIIVIDIKGRTIKKNGEIHEVKSDLIKETTLPANVPFLYKYNGKVKQFVFQNIEIGDEIEYYFTITYKYGYSLFGLSYDETIGINSEYPTLECKYSVYADKNMKFLSFNDNCNNTFVKKDYNGKILYELLVTNPVVNKEELFDNDNYSLGTVYYTLYYSLTDPIDTWDKFIKEQISKVSKKETMSSNELSIDNIASLAQAGTDINSKVKIAFDNINAPLEQDTLKLFKMLRLLSSANYYEAQQYVLLLKKMGISSNIILLKSKKNGPLNKNNIYDQFDDIMIEYASEDGKNHYIPIFKPHSTIDDINYKYQNTTALKVNPKNEIDFITVPVSNNANVYTSKYTININNIGINKSTSATEKSVTLNGAYEQIDRYSFLRETKDVSYHGFSNYEKKKIKSCFTNAKIKQFNLSSIKKNEIKWSVNYEYSLATGASANSLIININDIIEENYKIGISDRSGRTESAYLDFPGTHKYSYTITLPEDYVVSDNKLLVNEIKNNVGSVSSNYKILAPNKIELQFEFSLAKETISPMDWPLLLELYYKAYFFQTQKIYALKK